MEWMAQLSLELVIMMEVVVGVANFWMVCWTMVVVANQQLTSIYVQSKQGLYLGVEEGLRHQLMVMGKEGMHNSLLEFHFKM